MGTDEGSRLLTAYVFEEAGYVVYAAANARQAVAFALRLLPDVVMMQVDAPDTPEVLAQLAAASSTRDIPVVVLTASLDSPAAHRACAVGGVTLLPHRADPDVLVGEVDGLIAVGPRARRALRRRLLDLQEIARFFRADAEGQARVRRLIDHLQVAILALDEHGHCIAASEGATMLTGYSRLQLLTSSVFHAAFDRGWVADQRWPDFVATRHHAGTMIIRNQAGEEVTVHATAIAEILPGLHVAAFVAA